MTTDTERLDWLEKHGALLNTSLTGPHVCIDDGREGHFHAYGQDYRAAVDSAMASYAPYSRTAHVEQVTRRFDAALAEYKRVVGSEPQKSAGTK